MTETLRQRRTADTRAALLDAALARLAAGAPVSHEAVAADAGVGARTAYRHFPHQADLFAALWQRLRAATGTRFPARAEEIVPLLRHGFRSMDAHAELVRATLASDAGRAVRAQGAEEGRAAFAASLAPLLARLPQAEGRRLVAVCLALFSAPFWQLLRERGGLDGADAEAAAAFTMAAVLAAADPATPAKDPP